MTRARTPAVNAETTRVFLVDDHPLIRHAVRHLLSGQTEIELVGEAGGAPAAMTGIADTEPDLVICDLVLAEGGGLELIKDIKATWPGIKILVASVHTDTVYVERAFRAGASGYVTKAQHYDALLEGVRRVRQGGLYVCPDMLNTSMQRIVQQSDNTSCGTIDSLSDRELHVFELLGDGLSTREIAERLSLSIKTIETYRDNLKHKLSLDSNSQLLHRTIRCKIEREIGCTYVPSSVAPAGECSG